LASPQTSNVTVPRSRRPSPESALLPRMGITTGENASSLAGLLLTTEAVVTEKPEPKSGAPSMPGGGGMGDMYMY
jgi:hypothetical protein